MVLKFGWVFRSRRCILIRFFEERFLISNIVEVGKMLIIGDGYFENYSLASKGFSTVCLNIQMVLNHFIVAKTLKTQVNIDLCSFNFGGFDFPYEFFDYAAFFNNSFELIPYRTNRIDMLKFVNRFLKNDAFLSISLYNPGNESNIKKFEKERIVKETSKICCIDKARTQESLDENDYFYKVDGFDDVYQFKHLFCEDELVRDLGETGFEIVEFTDNDNLINGTSPNAKHMNELKGQYVVVSARKVSNMKMSKTI